jgi:hypothetical protein
MVFKELRYQNIENKGLEVGTRGAVNCHCLDHHGLI